MSKNFAVSRVSSFQGTFPTGDVSFHSEVIRRQEEKLFKIGSEFSGFWALNFKERAPNFLTQLLKLHSLRNMWKSLVAIGRGTSDNTRRKKERNSRSKI